MQSDWKKSARSCADESWICEYDIGTPPNGDFMSRFRAVITRYGLNFYAEGSASGDGIVSDWRGVRFKLGKFASFRDAEDAAVAMVYSLREHLGAMGQFPDDWQLTTDDLAQPDRDWRREYHAYAGTPHECAITLTISKRGDPPRFYPGFVGAPVDVGAAPGAGAPPVTMNHELKAHKNFMEADRTLWQIMSVAEALVDVDEPTREPAMPMILAGRRLRDTEREA